MKIRFNKFENNHDSKDVLVTLELDKYYTDRLYIALLASKIILRKSVYLSEEYDYVCDLISELGKYRRKK